MTLEFMLVVSLIKQNFSLLATDKFYISELEFFTILY